MHNNSTLERKRRNILIRFFKVTATKVIASGQRRTKDCRTSQTYPVFLQCLLKRLQSVLSDLPMYPKASDKQRISHRPRSRNPRDWGPGEGAIGPPLPIHLLMYLSSRWLSTAIAKSACCLFILMYETHVREAHCPFDVYFHRLFLLLLTDICDFRGLNVI